MARFIKGNIVVIPFPFSDLSGSKRRPALVLRGLPGDDVILCQITSQFSRSDPYAISLDASDFVNGSLPKPSNIRPNRIFTADENIIIRKAGSISTSKIQEVVNAIIKILS